MELARLKMLGANNDSDLLNVNPVTIMQDVPLQEQTLANHGWIFLDRYLVKNKLGSGGQAEVYLAYDKLRNRDVAIKRTDLNQLTEEQKKRLLREAEVLREISHPNIIPIFEDRQEGDWFYLVTPYADLGNLLSRLKTSEKGLSIEEVVDVGIAMCRALGVVHSAGVIHRDVKPSNVLLFSAPGESKPIFRLSDFGVARDVSSEKKLGRLTKLENPVIVGTPIYTAPETLREGEEHTNEGRDVYGLGATLYEALTKQASRDESRFWEFLTGTGRPPIPPSHIRVDCPEWLNNVILKALAHEPADRYSNTQEMLADLEAGKKALEPGAIPPQVEVKRRISWRFVAIVTAFLLLLLISCVSLSSLVVWSSLQVKPTPTPTFTPIASPASVMPMPTAAAMPSPTFTPTSTPTSTPTPTVTLTPTPTSTPFVTPTRTLSPISPTPIAVQPQLLEPVNGAWKTNPINFMWAGALNAGQTYQVTLHHVATGEPIVSGPSTTPGWTTSLPFDKTGEWRWQVSVIMGDKVLTTSSEQTFEFAKPERVNPTACSDPKLCGG